MRLANLLLVAGAAAAAFPLTTSCAVADGIPGVVMTDSQYVTDWSGVYIGGKVGGSWGHDDWLQLVPNFFDPTGSTDTTFSSSGVLGGILGGANLQMGQWVFGGELPMRWDDERLVGLLLPDLDAPALAEFSR